MKILENIKSYIKNKTKYKILSIIVIVFILLIIKDFTSSLIPLENIKTQVARVKIADEHDLSKMGKSYKDKIYENYDTVKFGKYYQSAINGFKTPIDWIVLAKEDGKVLLLSKYILDCKPFNDTFKKVCHWNNSTIRKWLNNSFYDEAFNDKEKRIIIESELENKKDIDAFYDSKATDSENTIDKVFLLSDAEFLKYLSANRFYQDHEYVEKERQLSIELWGEDGDKQISFNYDNATTCGTPYAYKQGLKNALFENTANYWLRTNMSKNYEVMFVTYEGWTFCDSVSAKIYGIRPAIWVSLEE